MKLCRVIGVVWATRKVSEVEGVRFHLVQPVHSQTQKPNGTPFVAADPHNISASGDLVVVVTNTDATQAFDSGFAPVNASIVELVDDLH